MNFSPMVNQFVGVLWYLIPIAILAAILKSPWFKGVAGEFIVNISAKMMLNKDEVPSYKKCDATNGRWNYPN